MGLQTKKQPAPNPHSDAHKMMPQGHVGDCPPVTLGVQHRSCPPGKPVSWQWHECSAAFCNTELKTQTAPCNLDSNPSGQGA